MEPLFHQNWNKLRTKVVKENILQRLADVIRIPSYFGGEGSETPVAEYIAQIFRQNGIEVQVKPVLNNRCNVLAKLPGIHHKPALLLTGHLDTVPIYSESQNKNPHEIHDLLQMVEKDGVVHGRGVVDMKGAIICMVMALIAIKTANIRLEGDVYFAGVIGEETASEGSCALLEEKIKWDAAIIGEPTQLDIALGHRGLEWLNFLIEGVTVHSGFQERGVNAIAYMKKWMDYLENELKPQLDRQTHPVMGSSCFNLGTIHGGTQPSTVAGTCKLQIDLRWVPPFTHSQILSIINGALEHFQKQHPTIKIHLKIDENSRMSQNKIHEATEISVHHPIVQALQQAAILVNQKPSPLTYFHAWTDAGVLGPYGQIPTVIFGPGDLTNAHTNHEYVEIDQLMQATWMYIAVCLFYCKTAQ